MNKRNRFNNNLIRMDVIGLAVNTDRAIYNHSVHIDKLYKLVRQQAKSGVVLSLGFMAIGFLVSMHEERVTKLEKRVDILTKELDEVQLQLEHTRFKDEGDI